MRSSNKGSRAQAGRALSRRRKLVVAFAVLGTGLAASPAFACVKFTGKMTVTGTHPLDQPWDDLEALIDPGDPTAGNGKHTVYGEGNRAHEYCHAAGPPPGPSSGYPQDGGPLVDLGVAGQTLLVEVAPYACPHAPLGAATQLPAGTYEVAVVNGAAYRGAQDYFGLYTFNANWGCWFTPPAYPASQKHTGFPGSTFTVNSAGVGSTTVTLPALTTPNNPAVPSDASVLCVGKVATGSAETWSGIFAPFTVLI